MGKISISSNENISLKEYTSYEIPEDYNIDDLIKNLNIDISEIGIVSVNGKRELGDYTLKEDDKVKFISYIYGG